MFKRYELAHSFYIVDAHEILRGVSAAQALEMQAADTVLVTKEDLLTETEVRDYCKERAALPYARVLSAPHGRFDAKGLPTPSGLTSFIFSTKTLALPSKIDTSGPSNSRRQIGRASCRERV